MEVLIMGLYSKQEAKAAGQGPTQRHTLLKELQRLEKLKVP